MSQDLFAKRLLAWYDRHGRKDLPWKRSPTPYRVWVSEVMLQQTQVATVIPYFERFMARFPTVRKLAEAPLDDVLALWAGLGYYARGRNLHKAAGIICERYDGRFPKDLEAVMDLPGIGRSTAGAILSLSRNERHAILDGNVKRVLTRYHAVEGWPERADILQRLWELAERHTPEERVADYNQAIMDLGAGICGRRRPACALCPVNEDCAARAAGRAESLPTPKPRKRLPVRQTTMVMLRNPKGEVLAIQRPPTGIWGGLWSLPECPPDADVARWCNKKLGLAVDGLETWPILRHTFSHFHLDITPVVATVANAPSNRVMEPSTTVWYKTGSHMNRGLPSPVQTLLQRLNDSETGVFK